MPIYTPRYACKLCLTYLKSGVLGDAYSVPRRAVED